MKKTIKDRVFGVIGHKSVIRLMKDDIKTIINEADGEGGDKGKPEIKKFKDLNLSEENINKSILNIKITLYIVLLAFLYSIFVLLQNNALLNTIYSGLFAIASLLFYSRYSFALYCFQNQKIITFMSWLKKVKKKPSLLLPL